MTTAHHYTPQSDKTYATRANAIKAVERVFGPNIEHFSDADIHYMLVQRDDGRWFPLFFGQAALQVGIQRPIQRHSLTPMSYGRQPTSKARAIREFQSVPQ